jgi:hypothetical protein
MKSGNAPSQSIRLLDQVRQRIGYMYYSLSTEKTCLHWVKFFVRWHGRNTLQFTQKCCIEDNQPRQALHRKSI